MRQFTVFALLILFSFSLSAQRANVLATFQMIENGKYKEAKEAIEEAVKDKNTARWAKTWYARGVLCQEAYEKGMKDNDKKLYELYPDQLKVAYQSYEKALSLNDSRRSKDQLEPRYVRLANEFMKAGEKHYKETKYKEAGTAFSHAVLINMSDVLSVELDTSLIYNAAISNYRAKDYDAAITNLDALNEMDYSPNVAHLLYEIYLAKEDSVKAVEVLRNGIEKYDYNEDLVLLLVDLYYQTKQVEEAVTLLDQAIAQDTASYVFPFTKGLILQKSERYLDAIDAYNVALEIDEKRVDAPKNIGTCLFNIGVEIDEYARTLSNNRQYREQKKESEAALSMAVTWYEKALELSPFDYEIKEQLIQLYSALNMTDKLKRIEQ